MIQCVLYAACFIGTGLCVWGLHCNERTHKERQAMIHAMQPGDPNFWSDMAIFDAVTYEQHYRARLFGRDPFALYKVPNE